jgi:response regulator RpfG family c-di-GMP phosphodiesterase
MTYPIIAMSIFLTASEQYREDQREVKYRDSSQELFIQKPISFEDLKRQIKERIGPTIIQQRN